MDSRSDRLLHKELYILVIDVEATCDEGDRLPSSVNRPG